MYYIIHPGEKPGYYYFCLFGKRAELLLESDEYESKDLCEQCAEESKKNWFFENA